MSNPENETLLALEQWVGQPLPPAYRLFLSAQTDELAVGDFVLLYGQTSFIERNETYESKQYCHSFITIGDDGGGRQILLSLQTEQVSLVNAGSMSPHFAEEIATHFSAWQNSNFLLPHE